MKEQLEQFASQAVTVITTLVVGFVIGGIATFFILDHEAKSLRKNYDQQKDIADTAHSMGADCRASLHRIKKELNK